MSADGPLQHQRRHAARGGRASGLTLIEISLVIGLLGLSALYVTEHYVADLKLQRQDAQVVGAINDALGILEASRIYWHSDEPSTTTVIAKWPHTSTTSGGSTTYTVAISELWNASNQFLAEEPPTRFPVECNNGPCNGYTLTGWDTSADTTSTTTADDELQLYFQVPTEREAQAVSAQLPAGSYECSTSGCRSGDPHKVTARIDRERFSFATGKCVTPKPGRFMRLCGENEEHEFTSSKSLYGLRRIAGDAQDPGASRQVTCEAGLRLRGAGVGMEDGEFRAAACGNSPTSPSAVLSMTDDGPQCEPPSTDTDPRPVMQGTFRDGDGNTHEFTYTTACSSSAALRTPYLRFDAYKTASSADARLELKAHNSFTGSTNSKTYPAGWDIHLMDSSTTAYCHRPVQQRLCRFRQPIFQGRSQYMSNTSAVEYDALCFPEGENTALESPGC